MLENQQYDKKSLRAITNANPNWKEIAKDCVAFANASGGILVYGIEDDSDEPPLGLIAQHNTLSAIELSKILGLENEGKAKDWIGKLQEYGLISSKGKTKGVTYSVAHKVLKQLNFTGITNMKKIEPHRLRELIREDLGIYHELNFGELHKHIGLEIPKRTVRAQIDYLVKNGVILKKGNTKAVKYILNTSG